MSYQRGREITWLYVMIDWHPVIHWYIFGVREILLVDGWAPHGVIDCIGGLISCVSLDIYQCLHILFQGICALLRPRSCCVIIELGDRLCCRYLHAPLCWLHLILYGRRRVFSLHRVRLALRSCLLVLLPTFRAFVFEPNLWQKALIRVSVNFRNCHLDILSRKSIFTR